MPSEIVRLGKYKITFPRNEGQSLLCPFVRCRCDIGPLVSYNPRNVNGQELNFSTIDFNTHFLWEHSHHASLPIPKLQEELIEGTVIEMAPLEAGNMEATPDEEMGQNTSVPAAEEAKPVVGFTEGTLPDKQAVLKMFELASHVTNAINAALPPHAQAQIPEQAKSNMKGKQAYVTEEDERMSFPTSTSGEPDGMDDRTSAIAQCSSAIAEPEAHEEKSRRPGLNEVCVIRPRQSQSPEITMSGALPNEQTSVPTFGKDQARGGQPHSGGFTFFSRPASKSATPAFPLSRAKSPEARPTPRAQYYPEHITTADLKARNWPRVTPSVQKARAVTNAWLPAGPRHKASDNPGLTRTAPSAALMQPMPGAYYNDYDYMTPDDSFQWLNPLQNPQTSDAGYSVQASNGSVKGNKFGNYFHLGSGTNPQSTCQDNGTFDFNDPFPLVDYMPDVEAAKRHSNYMDSNFTLLSEQAQSFVPASANGPGIPILGMGTGPKAPVPQSASWSAPYPPATKPPQHISQVQQQRRPQYQYAGTTPPQFSFTSPVELSRALCQQANPQLSGPGMSAKEINALFDVPPAPVFSQSHGSGSSEHQKNKALRTETTADALHKSATESLYKLVAETMRDVENGEVTEVEAEIEDFVLRVKGIEAMYEMGIEALARMAKK
ncbi:hypothetical protein BJ508DRAFT_334686 [Ascobolus immersus RN42]|uniref:Uncharacterized protein n=1 Tax=Ascobolus immersus RN42 TaxID=1160509 RepID=A0A3N4HF34_ASCIM|nr:hypothetical protein BJ508DRAFT_334686 [Ascobolus immersus RN42]